MEAGAGQSFILVNSQGSTAYDAKYGADGLHIWHQTPPLLGDMLKGIWDVESAAGKFTNGDPDPIWGKDPLEANESNLGTAAAVFDGVNETAFSCGTNPNTNLYVENKYSSPQSLKTGISIENIRSDPNSTDMLVEIVVSAKQLVIRPNGGRCYRLVSRIRSNGRYVVPASRQ